MRKLAAATLTMLVLVTACGGNDDPKGSSPPGDRDARASASVSSVDADDGIGAADDGDCTDATEVKGPGDVEMRDFAFVPTCLEISPTQALHVHNEGDNEHNLSIESLGLDTDVSSGDSTDLEASRFLPGSYTFFCKYHRRSNHMEGRLVIGASQP